MARRALLAVAVVLAVALLAAAGLGGYEASRQVRRGLEAAPTPTPTPSALASATVAPPSSPPGSAGPAAVAGAVATALRPVVAAPALGSRLRAQVADAATGAVLYAQRPDTDAAPASTMKLLTASAVLATRGGAYRIPTTLSTDGAGTVYLVGGGDPTLTAAEPPAAPAYAGAARLSDLAAQATRAKVPVRRVVVDDSRYSGPSVNPAWEAGDIPSDYASPVTAVMVDGGRASPSAVIRSSTPDLDAGRALAAQLGVPGAPVTRGTAPPTARVLGTVRSAPMSVLIGQMLQQSDNVIAECLARQVAVASHQPASFDGAATAVRSTLSALGVDVGAGLRDGSGLATTDRVAAAALVDVLRLIVSPEHPQLHPVVTGLPVAAWSGTLADRFLSGSAAGGAGVVRAKTGTLTGVSALAGLVHDRSGRLLAFALLADQVPATGTAAAEAALDRVAATLAACGCTS